MANGKQPQDRADHRRRHDGAAPAPCFRSSSASRNSRARPRTSCRRPMRSAWSKMWCAIISTTGWRKAPPKPTGCSISSSTGRGPAQEAAGKGSLAQVRHAQAAPARQARGLLQRRSRRHGNIPCRRRLRRRLRQTGARPRHPGDAAPARQDPERRQRAAGKLQQNRNSPIWCRRWAAARARNIATTICAMSASSS